MLPTHENCAFRASLDLHTFLSGSGRSPILVVGRSFRRCDQSRKYVPPETARPLPQARGQASAGDRRFTVVSGPSLSALCMARRSGERVAGELLFRPAARHVTLLHCILVSSDLSWWSLILKALAPDSILARDRSFCVLRREYIRKWRTKGVQLD